MLGAKIMSPLCCFPRSFSRPLRSFLTWEGTGGKRRGGGFWNFQEPTNHRVQSQADLQASLNRKILPHARLDLLNPHGLWSKLGWHLSHRVTRWVEMKVCGETTQPLGHSNHSKHRNCCYRSRVKWKDSRVFMRETLLAVFVPFEISLG